VYVKKDAIFIDAGSEAATVKGCAAPGLPTIETGKRKRCAAPIVL